jgi:hypothetical protein
MATHIGLPEMSSYLSHIEYKPGWSIKVYETPAQGVWIKFHANVEDSYHPGKMVELDIKSPVPPMKSTDEFLEWLRWRLERIEVHECHEWLRWKSLVHGAVETVPLFNPHADGADEPAENVW